MKRRITLLDKISVIGIIAAGLLAWAGDELEIPLMQGMALILFALFVIFFGLEAIATKQVSFLDEGAGERYRGAGAIAMGIGILLFGGIIAIMAITDLLGSSQGVEGFLADWPGFAIIGIGALFAAFGVAQACRREYKGYIPNKFQRAMSRIGGGLTALFGITLVGTGVIETIFPGLPKRMIAGMFEAAITRWLK